MGTAYLSKNIKTEKIQKKDLITKKGMISGVKSFCAESYLINSYSTHSRHVESVALLVYKGF